MYNWIVKKKINEEKYKLSKTLSLKNNINNSKFGVKFTISGLINYAYEHAPVPSMSGKPPLREIITIQPLKNIFDMNPQHTYFLTYIYYKTGDSFNGYGYLTCTFFRQNSVRAMVVVTQRTTNILASKLFDKDNSINTLHGDHQEPLNIYDMYTGTTIPLTIYIRDGEFVTITNEPSIV